MNWKLAIQSWRSLSPREQARRTLAQSPIQVWQSMAFEREPVSLEKLKAQHEVLLQQHRDSPPARDR